MGQAKRVVSVAKPILFDGSHLLIEAFQTFSHTKKAKIKCSGVSEKFCPAMESFHKACARALKEELKYEVVTCPTLLLRQLIYQCVDTHN